MSDKNDCGTKHLKLALWILGAAFGALLACGTFVARSIGAQEERLRTVEQQSARVETRLISIQETLVRLEKKGEQP